MNILVALDFSDITDRVVSQAAMLGREMDAKLWLLHVAQCKSEMSGFDVNSQLQRDMVAQKFHLEHRRIQTVADQLRQDKIDATALLIQGAAEQIIVHEALRLDANMIVIGSHGHGAMYHLILGSVGEGVMQEAPCPVLVVPKEQ